MVPPRERGRRAVSDTTTPTNVPAQRRSRWKRLVAIGLALVSVVWIVYREGETVRRSRELRLGMTIAQVEAVMGPPKEVTGSRFSDGKIIQHHGFATRA